jgi:hypothetical protein
MKMTEKNDKFCANLMLEAGAWMGESARLALDNDLDSRVLQIGRLRSTSQQRLRYCDINKLSGNRYVQLHAC